MLKSETIFARAALLDPLGIWNQAVIHGLSSHEIPDLVLGKHKELLSGDIKFELARWFSEGISDPLRFVADPSPYAKIYSQVRQVLSVRLATFNEEQVSELATVVTESLFATVRSIQQIGKRGSYSLATRQTLIDLAGNPARCWVCGSEFSRISIERFLGHGKEKIELPLFVDVLRGKGLIARDLQIEIDHVLPFSQGGGDNDNLRLACGWCNRHRSAWGAIYDAPGRARIAGENTVGLCSLPQHFWSVRLMAVIGQCEHSSGCCKTARNSELTICPDVEGGSLNPWNLSITCLEHDPVGANRFKSAAAVRQLWNDKRVH